MVSCFDPPSAGIEDQVPDRDNSHDGLGTSICMNGTYGDGGRKHKMDRSEEEEHLLLCH